MYNLTFINPTYSGITQRFNNIVAISIDVDRQWVQVHVIADSYHEGSSMLEMVHGPR